MTFETALRTRLKDNAPVAALVGTRIDWTVRPQKTALPALVLTLISDNRAQHMGGFNGFRETRVQVDCYAGTAKLACELRDAVIAAIAPAATVSTTEFLRSFINNVIDRSENSDTGFVHRQLVDVNIWHGQVSAP